MSGGPPTFAGSGGQSGPMPKKQPDILSPPEQDIKELINEKAKRIIKDVQLIFIMIITPHHTSKKHL